MITVSKLAASILLEALKESNLSSGESLRLIKDDGEFVLEVDIPGKGDRVIRYEGEVVLVVDKKLETEIGDARIDLEGTGEGNNLVMRRMEQSKN